LLADLPFKRFSFCMMNGTPAAAARLYALASWWLTYDPLYSVAAPIAPASDGTTIFPEFAIVPMQPRQTARGGIAGLARGGVYVREFASCYQAGVSIGRCAAIVNPSSRAVAIPALGAPYTRRLALEGGGMLAGGRATWRSYSANRMLGPVQATIVRQ
jgi:hypothetical protein